MAVTIIVLSDGETYSEISGCSICVITEQEYEALLNGTLRAKDLMPIEEMTLMSAKTERSTMNPIQMAIRSFDRGVIPSMEALAGVILERIKEGFRSEEAVRILEKEHLPSVAEMVRSHLSESHS